MNIPHREDTMQLHSTQHPTAATERLTGAQIAELAAELRDDLRRLVPDAALQPQAGSAVLDPRAQARLPLILAALLRVDAGTYGICAACREPIPYARLAAIPETRTCIDCVWRAPVGASS
jgi:hypothetical protein